MVSDITDGADSGGHLLVLNGGSSAGKTTLGRKLQDSLDRSWLLVGIDALMWTLPAEMVGTADGLLITDGEMRRGAEFMRLYAGFQRAVAGLVSDGIDVILDDVLLDGGEDQRRWDDAVGDLSACWVAVHCDPATAAEREWERGDRPPGIARAQAESVHRGVRYDLELDTGHLAVPDAVRLVAGHLADRWSIPWTPPTVGPPGLPATSAWGPDCARRPAPWEQ